MTFGQAVGTMTAPGQPTKHSSVQTGRANANAAIQTKSAATQYPAIHAGRVTPYAATQSSPTVHAANKKCKLGAVPRPKPVFNAQTAGLRRLTADDSDDELNHQMDMF